MINHLTKKVSDLRAGDRLRVGGTGRPILLEGRMAYQADSRGASVVASSHDRVSCRDDDGVTFEIGLSYGTPVWAGGGKDPVWTAPQPEGEPWQVKDYCDVLLAHGSGSLLMHVRGVGDNGFVADLVTVARRRDRDVPGPADAILPMEDGGEDTWTGATVGNADFWSAPLDVVVSEEAPTFPGPGPEPVADPLPAPGDLVLARSFRCRIEDGHVVTVAGKLVGLGNFPTRDAVGTFLPSPPGPYEPVPPGTADHLDHLEAQFVARLRTEPNEALVLWYDTCDGDRACRFISTRGLAFHNADTVEDMFYGNEEPRGLYVFSDARWVVSSSYEGETDAEMEGDWVPATLDDIARFGFASAEDLDREIWDTVEAPDGTEADHAAARYVEMAAAQPVAPSA